MTPFRIDVSQDRLDRILGRVRDFDWTVHVADHFIATDWRLGTDQEFLRRLCRNWVTDYDWRAAEARLNRFDQFITLIDDQRVHFYHEIGSGPDPQPLILIHGWPGSIFEFQALIEPLAHPERFGGNVADAFTVIVPSIPGYGFSVPLKKPFSPREIARMFDRLMREVLGYDGYIAQGGDWGSFISSWMGYEAPGCRAIHLNMMGWRSPGVLPETEAEHAHFARIARVLAREGGYREIQRTKPQSLAYAMMDSPVGMCAWIVEKFHGWSDTRQGFEAAFTFDQLLTNVMLYLVTESFMMASLLYHARDGDGEVTPPVPSGQRVERPVAIANFPQEFVPFPPRSFVERNMNVVQWTDMPRGGHFAALECGDLLVDDLRSFRLWLAGSSGV